jgi:hypothetical protein
MMQSDFEHSKRPYFAQQLFFELLVVKLKNIVDIQDFCPLQWTFPNHP